MRALGCPVETLQAARVRCDAGVFEVWPENWEMFQVFVALGGQWRWVPGGMAPPVRDGIDAPSIESVFRLMGVRKKDWKETYAALRLMERAVIEVQNRKAARH